MLRDKLIQLQNAEKHAKQLAVEMLVSKLDITLSAHTIESFKCRALVDILADCHHRGRFGLVIGEYQNCREMIDLFERGTNKNSQISVSMNELVAAAHSQFAQDSEGRPKTILIDVLDWAKENQMYPTLQVSKDTPHIQVYLNCWLTDLHTPLAREIHAVIPFVGVSDALWKFCRSLRSILGPYFHHTEKLETEMAEYLHQNGLKKKFALGTLKSLKAEDLKEAKLSKIFYSSDELLSILEKGLSYDLSEFISWTKRNRLRWYIEAKSLSDDSVEISIALDDSLSENIEVRA